MSETCRFPGVALWRFAKEQRGVIAVEFALIAPVLLIMMFGFIELLLSFLLATTLETAAATAARDIRTGRFQAANGADAKEVQIQDFKDAVCGGIAWLSGDCSDRLSVQSRTYISFPELQSELPLLKNDSGCWQTGTGRSIVLVKARFRWRVITPLLRGILGETSDGYQFMSTMAVFQNEPFAPPAQTRAPLCR